MLILYLPKIKGGQQGPWYTVILVSIYDIRLGFVSIPLTCLNIKAMTALVGILSMSVGWRNGFEQDLGLFRLTLKAPHISKK